MTEPGVEQKKRGWIALLGLCVAVLVPVLPLLLQRAFVLQHDVVLSDLIHNQFPYRAFLGERIREGSIPLWMPDVYSGVPFLAQIEAGLFYLPHAVLFGLFEPYTALNLAIVLALLTSAVGAWALARYFGSSRLGAALAGFVFAYCGFNVSHVRHLNMHAAAALLPWILLCFERGLDRARWRWYALAAVLLCLQVFAGHPQVTYITLLWMLARLATRVAGSWIEGRRTGRARAGATALMAAGGAAAIGIGLGLAAIQLLPTLAFNATSMRGEDLSWEFASRFPYYLPDLWTFIVPEATGTLAGYDYAGSIEWENYGYCGLLVLPLAALAVWRRRKDPGVVFLAASLVVAMLLVVGPATPLYRLAWSIVPGMDLFRFPTRFLLVVDLALALLAGLGLTTLARARTGRGLALTVALVVAFTFADLWFWQLRRIPMDDIGAWRPPGPVADAIHEAGVPGRVYVALPQAHWQRATDVARGFQNGFDAYRQVGALPLGNYGVLKQLRSADGYVNMLSTRTGAFWQHYNLDLLPRVFRPDPFDFERRSLTPAFQSLLDRASVRYLVSPFRTQGERQQLLWSGGEVGLFLNRSALPRAYVARDWRPCSTVEEAARWILEEGAEQTTVPAIEGAPPPPEGAVPGIEPVEVAETAPHAFELDLSRAGAGQVVLSDSFDSGWEAHLDGEPVAIRVANGYQMAVRCDAASRRLTLDYHPPGLRRGILVSLTALVLLLLGGVPWRFVRRRVDGESHPGIR